MQSAEFKNQCVRDLAWAVSSPPLIARLSNQCAWPDSRWYRTIYQQTLPWFRRLDLDPAELEDLLGRQKDRRLGKYFETLWLYWLSHYSRYDIVENNVQINIDGETLGEIDFIVFDKYTNKTIHWELAVKFYLGVDNTREMHNWHGPNLRDRLDIKVDHLLHRQSMLSRDKRVTQWLKQQGIDIDECAVVLKGRLYFPWSVKPENRSLVDMLPALCAPELLYGWWFKQSEFDENYPAEQTFAPLINSGWLEKIPTDSVDKFSTKNDIFKTLSNNVVRLPLHLQLENPCHSWDRAFLVEENWGQQIT